MMLYDAHCHVDFATDPAALAEGLASAGVRVASATVTPSGYRKALHVLGGFSNVRIGLGLHPWWVADGRLSSRDVQEFCSLASAGQPLISEVGLDFSPRCLERSISAGLADFCEQAKELQLEAFRKAMLACVGHGLFVSLHSVKAEECVLDVLEQTGVASTCSCVFHGFAGSQDQLFRALDMGCYVSVGPRMLSTKRGKAYAKIIPAERTLLETDAPSSQGIAMQACAMRDALACCLDDLADMRGLDAHAKEAFVRQMEETSRRLLGF